MPVFHRATKRLMMRLGTRICFATWLPQIGKPEAWRSSGKTWGILCDFASIERKALGEMLLMNISSQKPEGWRPRDI
jgi:hypothetical protein